MIISRTVPIAIGSRRVVKKFAIYRNRQYLENRMKSISNITLTNLLDISILDTTLTEGIKT